MQQNELLNQVLIVMGRSLLQYSAEAWPWTGDGSAAARSTVEGLVGEQSSRIGQLADLLDARRFTVDFGVFPDHTDLHYLSLEYFLPHLIQNQRSVVREIETVLPQCASDAEGSALLTEILQGERAALAKLEELSRPQPATPAQSAA
jgi:hypothetical protein